jgi:hypothetical protein
MPHRPRVAIPTVKLVGTIFRRINRSSLVAGGKSSSLGGLASPAPSSLLSHGVYQSNHHHHHQQQQQQQQRQQAGVHLLPFLDRPGANYVKLSSLLLRQNKQGFLPPEKFVGKPRYY